MFKQQPLPGPCGIYSLQGALHLLQDPKAISTIRRAVGLSLIGSYTNGADDIDLLKALDTFGYKYKEIYYRSADKYFDAVAHEIHQGFPCVITTQESMHWSVLFGKFGTRYAWYDPNDTDLIGLWTKAQIKSWIDEVEYYAISIRPLEGKVSMIPSITEEQLTTPAGRLQLLRY